MAQDLINNALRRQQMRDHFGNYWFLYAAASLFGLMITIAVNANITEQRRINYCFDRGMVLVDTPAGKRCAEIHSLERVR
jgi:hypothetical protein